MFAYFSKVRRPTEGTRIFLYTFQCNGLALIGYGRGQAADQPIFEDTRATDRTRIEVFPMLDQIRGPRHRQMQLQIIDNAPKDLQVLGACPVTREM